MSRKRELTWQPGSSGRPGRWRKIFRGKSFYFDGGRGKSDDIAYRNAINTWRQQEQDIRQATSRPNQAEYDAELERWQQVLIWSRQHNDEVMVATATQKLQLIRSQLRNSILGPVPLHLTFDGHFKLEYRNPAQWRSMQAVVKYLENNRLKPSTIAVNGEAERLNGTSDTGPRQIARRRSAVIEPPLTISIDKSDDLELERLIWLDRIKVSRAVRGSTNQSVATQVELFLQSKSPGNGIKSISLGRFNIIRRYLNEFARWIGTDVAVSEIKSQELIRYHKFLVDQIASSKLASSTADDRLSSVKTFMRWLWQTEAVENLPRVLLQRTNILEIGKTTGNILTFTMDEIGTLFQQASQSTRLYILLSLNAAMTQKDISDLANDEVDWKQRRVNRKRSKTKAYKNVPLVSYKLWPETYQLLYSLRNLGDGGKVLLNQRGEPLVHEQIDAAGKFRKSDCVRRAFGRLRQKTDIERPFKSLKKTSASMLRGNSKYQSIVGLFLGHAPREVSDRHYAAVPQGLLDEAIGWLRDQYGPKLRL